MTKAIIRETVEIPYSEGTIVIYDSERSNGRTRDNPFYGPANSKTLLEQIRGPIDQPTGLVEPTTRDVVFVSESLFDDPRKIGQEFTERMKRNYLRAFTGIAHDPKTKLVSFVDYPKFDERSIVDGEDLAKRVNGGEFYEQVSFDQVGANREIKWGEVAKNRYIIAWTHGEEGAERLADLTSRHPNRKLFLYVPDVSRLTERTARVAALVSAVVRLYVAGDGYGGDGAGSYAFGVAPAGASGEAPQKNSTPQVYTKEVFSRALDSAGFPGEIKPTLEFLPR